LLICTGVARSRIGVVVPGTDPASSARGSKRSGFVRLLCVAAVTEGKGHEFLMEALAKLKHLVWELECVGSVDREPATVAALRRTIARHGLEKRGRLAGEMPQEALAEVYGRADVFVLASVFESYGMALAEALAHGLPVVSTTGGAIPQVVPRTAGLLVEPRDPTGLSRALEAVINDPSLRARLSAGALAAGRLLPTWAEATIQFAEEVWRV
jgi:glycosyltransferase involved in cell wall biosynthesis